MAAIVIYHLKPVAFATPSNLYLYQTFFLVMMLIMFIVALPVGAIFGWLATRGLRERLATLSAALQAWSKGDFSVSPRDRSGDEIGELTRNLNGMAEQLQTLIHTNDELARVEERNRLARDLHDTVRLDLNMSPDQVSLIVADNGRGFDVNAVSPSSYGLPGMQGRLREVGGTLNVESTPSAGTTITAEVQLHPRLTS